MKEVYRIAINGRGFIAQDKKEVIETIDLFLDGNKGDTFKVSIEEMSQEEYDKLKEFEGF